MDDPYNILGVSRNASEVEIKRRYHELAKKHHPDKLAHLSPEERAENEETFKKITTAYEYLRQPRNANSSLDWAAIWNRFQEWAKSRKYTHEHEIEYEIPIEDIITERTRKIRIFLSGQQMPIYVNIAAMDVFNEEPIRFIRRIGNVDHKINLNLKIVQDPDYWFDWTMWGFYTSTTINWYEYLTGCKRTFKVPGHRPQVVADIPAFSRGPIEIVLTPRFMLYIVIEIEPPSEEPLECSKDYEEFKNFLRKWSERALSS